MTTYKSLAKTDEFVINDRSQRLHLRSFQSESDNIKGAIVMLHGYGAHNNRPVIQSFANKMNSNGFHVITFDFHSHGYSDGTFGLVMEPQHLIDDCTSVLDALLSGVYSTDKWNINMTLKDIPFYICGHSMGGAVGLLVSQMYESHKHFKGNISICPAIDLEIPEYIWKWLIQPLSYTIPSFNIPQWIYDENSCNNLCWPDDSYRKYIETDKISYRNNIQFGTLNTIMNLGNIVRSKVDNFRFPLIIFHDPTDDIIIPYNSSLTLFENSKSYFKHIIPIFGGKHDILANRQSIIIDKLLSFIEK